MKISVALMRARCRSYRRPLFATSSIANTSAAAMLQSLQRLHTSPVSPLRPPPSTALVAPRKHHASGPCARRRQAGTQQSHMGGGGLLSGLGMSRRVVILGALPAMSTGGDLGWLWTFGSVPELPPKDVQALSDRLSALPKLERSLPATPRIIDVRTEMEFTAGHIAGAVNASFLPPWSFADRMKALLDKDGGVQPDTPMLLVCLSGHRSIGALKWLNQQGYKDVHQLAGGMLAWQAAGLPETK